MLVTFIGCLVDTSDGILIGIATHLVILLFHYAIPTIEDYEQDGIVKIEIKSNLYFPSAEKISDQMNLYHGLYTSKNYEVDFKNCDELDSASGITFSTFVTIVTC